MKHILSLITVFTLLFTACEGDPGPQGPQGAQGTYIVGQSFENEIPINFTSTNGFQDTLEIPLDIELFESDMVLVYRLVDVVDGYDVWRLLPETVYTDDGSQFTYNYEHNYDLVTIYLEGSPSLDLSTLPDDYRIDQFFRVVVLPVDFASSNNIDINNYSEVMKFVE